MTADPYIPHLRALPFVTAATVAHAAKGEADARLRLKTPTRTVTLSVLEISGALDRFRARGVLDTMGARGDGWILFAPAIPADLGRELAQRKTNFVDRQGNCFLALGTRYMAHVEGRTAPARPPQDRSLRAPGYQTLFALLAKPALLDAPLRTLAMEAGVSRQAAVDARARLDAGGEVLATRRGRVWSPKGWRDTLDRWLVGWRDTLRPRLVLGRFTPAERDPEALEARIAPALDALGPWRWGGTAAGFRLTGHYRGPRTVVHLDAAVSDARLAKALRALPDPAGSLVVLRAPGPVAFEGATDDTVHPLLAYAEMNDGDERALEASVELRARYLAGP